jgi:N-dimethylarginine dimethylaminohydrolase
MTKRKLRRIKEAQDDVRKYQEIMRKSNLRVDSFKLASNFTDNIGDYVYAAEKIYESLIKE